MNCINFKIRSKKYERYYYCANRKEEIEFSDCKNCDNLEYKEKKQMKSTKSRRTIATEAPAKIREIVFKRDKGKCVICNNAGVPNAHYIKRSQGRTSE